MMKKSMDLWLAGEVGCLCGGKGTSYHIKRAISIMLQSFRDVEMYFLTYIWTGKKGLATLLQTSTKCSTGIYQYNVQEGTSIIL